MRAKPNLFGLCRVQPTFLKKSMNAVLIHKELTQSERLKELNKMAILQMKSLLNNNKIQKLKE
jgi:hypothetical protein